MKLYNNKEVNYTGCPSCAYANKEFSLSCGIAYENDNFILNQDWELPIPGFLIVCPKRHVEKLSELTKVERDEIFDIVDKTINILRKNNICDRFNVIFEEKENIHFHIWIMPRYKWMSDNFGKITKNIDSIFKYAKTNMRTKENFDKINEITKIVKREFNK